MEMNLLDKTDYLPVIIQGTHICLIPNEYSHHGILFQSTSGNSRRVPAVPLHEIFRLYDVNVEYESLRGHTVQNSKNKAPLRIEELVYKEDPVKNGDGEIIMTQYPNGKDQQVVYLGDQNRAINIRQVKNDSCEKEFSFCCSRNKSLREIEIIFKLPSYGYLIGDFIGTNGNQQVLFLPQLTTQNLEDQKLALLSTHL